MTSSAYSKANLKGARLQSVHTPKDLYDRLDAEHHFDHDPCPKNDNPDVDGLLGDWGESNFCNPPFNNIAPWLQKGWEQAQLGRKTVFLLPSRTNTKYFHEMILPHCDIEWIRGYLAFPPHKTPAPFPCMICVMRPELGMDVDPVTVMDTATENIRESRKRLADEVKLASKFLKMK